MEKQGTPTMGGLIILASILIPTLLFAKLNNIYILLMIFTVVWLDTKEGPLVIEIPPGVLGMINDCWGRGTLHSAAEGLSKDWKMKREKKSPAYTTNWSELPVAS